MQVIPLSDFPSQALSVQLAGQACKLLIYVKTTGLFADLYVADKLLIGGVICQHKNRIVRDAYLGFIGDLIFLDTQGKKADPTSPGLGSRWLLVYLDPADISAGLDAYGASLIGVPPVFPLMSVPRPALPFFMASGFAGSVGSASLFLRDALAAAGVTTSVGMAFMTGVVALAGAGVTYSTGSASLAVGLVFAAAGFSAATGAAALTSQSALRATGTSTSVGTAAITSSAVLMAAGTASSSGTAMLVSGGFSTALGASGISNVYGIASLQVIYIGAWNPLDGSPGMGANLVFSNKNRQITKTNSSSVGVRSSGVVKSSGKWYFEVEVTNVSTSNINWFTGVMTNTGVLSDLWTSATEDMVFRANGQVFRNGGGIYDGAFGAVINGDILGFACDVGNNVGIYLNNSLFVVIPYARTGIVPLARAESGATGQSMKLNAEAAALNYSPPVGYSAWN